MKPFNTARLWPLFYTFLKAGTVTFAGGLAMLPLIERDVVERYDLMPRDEFLEYATLSQTLPGVIALNCAAFVGRRAAGLAGMFAAGLGAVLPAYVFMLLATVLLEFIPQKGAVIGAFAGVRAASAALVLSAAYTLGRHNLKTGFALGAALAAFALLFWLKVSAPLIVLLGGAAGCLHHAAASRRARKGEEQ